MNHLINLKLLTARMSAASSPPYLGFLLSKSKRRYSRSKSDPPTIRNLYEVKPSNSVSIDYLLSSTPGLKLQSLGRLNAVPALVSQNFTDHCCEPTFLRTQFLEDFTLNSSINTKVKFKRVSAKHTVHIAHCRGDNVMFGDAGFKQECASSCQTLDLSFVNILRQNDIAKSSISYL